MAGVAVGVTLVVVVATFAIVRADEDVAEDPPEIGRAGSEVRPDADDVAIERAPATARVVYRVETGGGASISVVTDTLSSRRPFESRLETRSGPPPGTGEPTARVGWFLHTATVSSSTPSIVQVAPGLPPTDLRLDVALEEAVERDLVERREVREVAGRACQVYRSRDTLAAPVRAPERRDFVDTCVDEAGLVLEEVVTVEGTILTRRVAVDVEEDVVLDDSLFTADGTPASVAGGGGSARKLKGGSMPEGEFWVLDTPPAGFEHAGRYSVVPPQPENFSPEDPTREGFRRAAVVDVWRRGVDIITVEQGGTLQGAEAFEPVAGAPPIGVPPFGDGELILSGAGVELRVKRDGGRYLRVIGTTPVDELLSVAASLRATQGNTLEFEET